MQTWPCRKKSKVILGSTSEQLGRPLVPDAVDQDSPMIPEKLFSVFFLPYMGIAAILFNGAEPFEQFEQINYTPSSEGFI